MQANTSNQGVQSAIDIYQNSLFVLKEKVMALLGHYHETILRKVDCDLGNLVNWDTSVFQDQFTDVIVQLNEIEVQLSTMEAWMGLPPECFLSPANVYNNAASSVHLSDPDQIALEAQTLVEAVKLVQNGLHEMISKPRVQDPEAARSELITTSTSAL